MTAHSLHLEKPRVEHADEHWVSIPCRLRPASVLETVTIMPDGDDIALLHVSAKDLDKLVARAAVHRQRNASKGE
jgi:hypothetical protein